MNTLQTVHKINQADSLLSFELSDHDVLGANLLAPTTIAVLQTRVAILTQTLASTEFSGKSEHEVLQLVREFIYLQGRRAALLEILEDCSASYQAASTQSPT